MEHKHQYGVTTALTYVVIWVSFIAIPRGLTAAENQNSGREPILVVDQAGRSVKLGKPAMRILSLSPSNTELLFHLGAGDRLVGRSVNCDYPEEVAQVPSVGSLFPPDYERLIHVKADLVLMSSGTESVRSKLEGYGFTVIVLQPKSVEAIADSLSILGKALGINEISTQKINSFRAQLTDLTSHKIGQRPRVFYEVWSRPLSSAGPTSFLGDLITVSGGANVITDPSKPWPQVSEEAVIHANPDVIFTSHPASHSAMLSGTKPAWKYTHALKKKQVYLVPDENLLVRPGPRILKGIRWMRDTLAKATVGRSRDSNE